MIMVKGLLNLKKKLEKQYRPYYEMLPVIQKKAYDDACKGFISHSTRIPLFGITASFVATLFELIRLDNPWFFFVDSISVQHTDKDSKVWIIPQYRMSISEVNESLEKLWKVGDAFRRKLDGKTDFQKELYIHDSLCRHIEYTDSLGPLSHECLGPLLYKKGVCEGIAKAVKFLFDFNSIRSIVVRGDALDPRYPGMPFPHTWNIAEIGSMNYNIDVTFDLTLQAHKVIRYDYFNLSDSEISVDHLTPHYSVPPCGASLSYYKQSGLFMKTPGDLRRMLGLCFQKAHNDCVFQLPTSTDIDKAKSKICELSKTILLSLGKQCYYLELNYSESRRVFHLHITYDSRQT